MQRFHRSHAGQTALLVGNGENLLQTPPHWFDYPAFGMNTIHKLEGWKPDYYTAVDTRVMREFGDEIADKFADIPKFVPSPHLDDWHGQNFYRFGHRPGAMFPAGGKPMTDAGYFAGICYGNVMQVAMQLAIWMGFATLIIIGMEHKPEQPRNHFWGFDDGMHGDIPVGQWLGEYAEIVQQAHRLGVRVLNISQDTYVSDKIIPRGDWREWKNK